MACEIGVEITVTWIVAKKKLEYLQDVIFDSYSLATERTRQLFNTLTGEHVQQAQFWANFKACLSG
jgi:hypothetical protein